MCVDVCPVLGQRRGYVPKRETEAGRRVSGVPTPIDSHQGQRTYKSSPRTTENTEIAQSCLGFRLCQSSHVPGRDSTRGVRSHQTGVEILGTGRGQERDPGTWGVVALSSGPQGPRKRRDFRQKESERQRGTHRGDTDVTDTEYETEGESKTEGKRKNRG